MSNTAENHESRIKRQLEDRVYVFQMGQAFIAIELAQQLDVMQAELDMRRKNDAISATVKPGLTPA